MENRRYRVDSSLECLPGIGWGLTSNLVSKLFELFAIIFYLQPSTSVQHIGLCSRKVFIFQRSSLHSFKTLNPLLVKLKFSIMLKLKFFRAGKIKISICSNRIKVFIGVGDKMQIFSFAQTSIHFGADSKLFLPILKSKLSMTRFPLGGGGGSCLCSI